ncbi:MAG: alanine racemase, partial [Actinomycetales bacterium]
MSREPQAEAVIDLDTYRSNLEALRAAAPGALQMPVVKADAYGHGLAPVARAAREAGADWLGVATGAEALALREAGDTGPVLCWLAAPGADFTSLAEADVEVTGVWSHFACADEPDHPANDEQERVFTESVEQLEAAGIAPRLRHLANSAATLVRPSSHLDLVRVGIASYGISPDAALQHGVALRPVMTLRGRAVSVKRVPAGRGVSYGHTYVTD